MKLFTQYEYAKLIKNGKPESQDKDHYPVVKLFTCDKSFVGLITEIYDLDQVFGLFDFGKGVIESGSISVSSILNVRDAYGTSVLRDNSFLAHFPISVYLDAAIHFSRIIESEIILRRFL